MLIHSLKLFTIIILSAVIIIACEEENESPDKCTQALTPEIASYDYPESGKSNGVVEVVLTGSPSNALEFSKNDTLYQDIGRFSQLSPGTYTFYVRNDDGCKGSVTFSLIERPALAFIYPEDKDSVGFPLEVKFSLQNATLSQNGFRISYFIDGLQQGTIQTGNRLSIHQLDEGWRELKIALTDQQGSLTGLADSIAIYAVDSVHSVMVTNGVGSGDYKLNELVTITADNPAQGKVFDVWKGDNKILADSTAATTTFKMPLKDVTLEAFFKDQLYELIVMGGSGSGEYAFNEMVNISANKPAPGFAFKRWTGDTETISNSESSNTTVTMPDKDLTIIASYDAIAELFALTVINGSGSGNYPAGTMVNISADQPETGKTFDQWAGDVSFVADVMASTTKINMPDQEISVEASYKFLPVSYNLDVKPLFQTECLNSCHDGSGNESTLLTYDQQKAEASLILSRVKDCNMPPTGSCLPQTEISKIQAWVEQGAPNN